MGIYIEPPSSTNGYGKNKKAKDAFEHAQKIGQRYPEGEDDIAQDLFYSSQYARLIGRFEKGEITLSKDAKFSAYYAIKIIEGRFELGEPAISKSAYYTCAYVLLALDGAKIESINRAMMSRAISDEKENYWVKEYFRYMQYLDGQGSKPYWADKKAAINWF